MVERTLQTNSRYDYINSKKRILLLTFIFLYKCLSVKIPLNIYSSHNFMSLTLRTMIIVLHDGKYHSSRNMTG